MNPANMIPMAKGGLASLGKSSAWKRLFGEYADKLGDAWVPGKVAPAREMMGKSLGGEPLSSRGFAGASYRNPLQPDFASAGPHVMEGEFKSAINPRVRKITLARDDAAEAAAAIRGDHIDSSRLGKLKRLLLESKGGMAALGGVGGVGLGTMMSGSDEEELDPRIIAMMQGQGGGYGGF